jgi:hypothetical protein
MRRTILMGLLISLATLTFGQQKAKLVEYYERHDQVGVPLRWYWQARGIPTTVWIETLQLTDDKRFVYYTSSTCLPAWAYGTWEKEKNVLILKADSTSGPVFDKDSTSCRFIISNRRLYRLKDIERKDQWVMKRQ